MPSLAYQKCLNHGEREAVARCPQCRSHFCRECVSEHRGRILCAQCLAKAALAEERNPGWRLAWIPVGAAAGIAMAWLFFLTLGKLLVLIPASYHDGAWAHETQGQAPAAAQKPAGSAGKGGK
ncbi:MAG: rhomboid family protein [Fibrobacteres bacterium]|nr:rhomboid family protein [Fibrobacterota bacterium]